jgi:hypothetical protein
MRASVPSQTLLDLSLRGCFTVRKVRSRIDIHECSPWPIKILRVRFAVLEGCKHYSIVIEKRFNKVLELLAFLSYLIKLLESDRLLISSEARSMD